MTNYKVGTRINLQKNKQRAARKQAAINLVFTLLFGGLAAYGLMDLILRANGIN